MPRMPIDRGVTRISVRLCPYCGYHFDAVGTVDGTPGTPVEGDVTLCLQCTEPLMFDGPDCRMRKPTPTEQAALKDSPDWAEMRAAQSRIHAARRQGMRTKQEERGMGKPH